MFGVKNFVTEKSDGTVAPSFYANNTTGLSTSWPNGYSFVFVDRVIAVGHSEANQKKDFDRIVIHELGHQRGIITYTDHTIGHNGTNKRTCVMFNPSDITDNTLLQSYYNGASFCEGHRQLLYNIFW